MTVRARAPITVIIPCYEASKTLNRSFTSIADQTLLPSEVIAVNDASNDKGLTLAALEAVKARYQDLFVISILDLPVNVGAAGARNAGLEKAKYPFVAFLDADDSWHPAKLEVQYSVMKDNPSELFTAHTHITARERFEPLHEPPSVIRHSFTEILFKNRCITPSIMIRNRSEVRFAPEQRYMEDHLLWMMLAKPSGLLVIQAPLAQIHKPAYGASGLSSHMVSMFKADVKNYWILFGSRHLNLAQALFFSAWALAKGCRRFFLHGLKSLGRTPK